jgi:hypothetical protein
MLADWLPENNESLAETDTETIGGLLKSAGWAHVKEHEIILVVAAVNLAEPDAI